MNKLNEFHFAMENSPCAELKSKYEVSGRIDAFYNGGPVVLSNDKKYLICLDQTEISIIDAKTKTVAKKIDLDDDALSSLALHPTLPILAVGSKSLNIHLVNYSEGEAFASWRAHDSPSLSMEFHPSGQYLASGAADGSVRVFDLSTKAPVAHYRNHTNLVRGIRFHPANSNYLFSHGDDGRIIRYNLSSKEDVVVDESTHGSAVLSITFIFPGEEQGLSIPPHGLIIAGGNSNVLSFSDSYTLELVKETPVFESITGIVFVTGEEAKALSHGAVQEPSVLIAGSRGVLRYLNPFNREISEIITNKLHTSYDGKSDIDEDLPSYSSIFRCNTDIIASSTVHNIYVLSMLTGEADVYFGNPGEYSALDANEEWMVTADSSGYIRLMKRETGSTVVLSGHRGIVLSVFLAPEFIISGSRDSTIGIWTYSGENLALLSGHTGPVTAVVAKDNYIISGSDDGTIKVWSLFSHECENTIVAHEKSITALALPPKGSMFASASQDKTIKIWESPSVRTPKMTLRGHKKQVWCINFSEHDRLLVSGSTDCSAKVWSLKSGAVMRSFEGSPGTILGATFVTRGTQLITTCADGSLTLWNLKSSESVAKFKEHEDKIWGIKSLDEGDELITVDGSGSLVYWKDNTAEYKAQLAEEDAEKAQEEQEIANSMRNEDFSRALMLALKRNHGKQSRIIIERLAQLKGNTALPYITEIFKQISRKENTLLNLVEFIIQWNTNNRTCYAAQLAMNALFRSLPLDYLSGNIPGGEGKFTAMYAYTARHLDRIDRLQRDSKIAELAYATQHIKLDEVLEKEDIIIEGDLVEEAVYSEEEIVEEVDGTADKLRLLLEAAKNRRE